MTPIQPTSESEILWALIKIASLRTMLARPDALTLPNAFLTVMVRLALPQDRPNNLYKCRTQEGIPSIRDR